MTSIQLPRKVADYVPAGEGVEPIQYILCSHSNDNLFDYCPRKFEFLNMFDRRPPRESGFAAQVGTALHEGTQAWLIARQEGLSESKQIEHCFMALLLHYPHELEDSQWRDTRSLQNTMALQWEIIRSSEWDNWDLVRLDNNRWAIEVPFVIKHTSLGTFRVKNTGKLAMLVTQGKIDFILQHRVTKKIRTKDLKTTITKIELVDAEYTFSGQQTGYGQVLQAMLGEEVTKGFEIEYVVARFSDSDYPSVQHIPIPKTEEAINDYWATKIDRLHRIKAYAESGWFPRTNGGCHSWGQQCGMFDICPSRDYDLIEDWFRTMPMEPTQGYDWWVTLEV